MTRISEEKLGEILAAAEKATQTPWRVELIPGSYKRPAVVYSGDKLVASCLGDQLNPAATSIGEARANAAFIARLDPTTVSSLVTELRELREAVEAARMARTRLYRFADEANAGRAEAGGRELSRKVWGAFAEFTEIMGDEPRAALSGAKL
jgi:hypothetical protein